MVNAYARPETRDEHECVRAGLAALLVELATAESCYRLGQPARFRATEDPRNPYTDDEGANYSLLRIAHCAQPLPDAWDELKREAHVKLEFETPSMLQVSVPHAHFYANTPLCSLSALVHTSAVLLLLLLANHLLLTSE